MDADNNKPVDVHAQPEQIFEPAQESALKRLFELTPLYHSFTTEAQPFPPKGVQMPELTFKEFKDFVQTVNIKGGVVGVRWCGVFMCITRDGHVMPEDAIVEHFEHDDPAAALAARFG